MKGEKGEKINVASMTKLVGRVLDFGSQSFTQNPLF